MTDKLIQKQISFLLQNLEYNEEFGRGVVLAIIQKIIEIFPLEIIKHYVFLFFCFVLHF